MLGFPYRGSEVSQRALRRPRAVLRLASSFSSSRHIISRPACVWMPLEFSRISCSPTAPERVSETAKNTKVGEKYYHAIITASHGADLPDMEAGTNNLRQTPLIFGGPSRLP